MRSMALRATTFDVDQRAYLSDLERLVNSLESSITEARRLIPLAQRLPLDSQHTLCRGGGVRVGTALTNLVVAMAKNISIIQREVSR